jgi:hypothetical protein
MICTGLNLPLDWNPADGSYEQSNELSGSVKCRKCVGWLSSHWLQRDSITVSLLKNPTLFEWPQG